jgi:hypothetical protein
MKTRIMSEEELVELSRRVLPPREELDDTGHVEAFCETRSSRRVYDDPSINCLLVLEGERKPKDEGERFRLGYLRHKGKVWTLYNVKEVMKVEGPGWKAERIGPDKFRVEMEDE